jgi:hypothetical protein
MCLFPTPRCASESLPPADRQDTFATSPDTNSISWFPHFHDGNGPGGFPRPTAKSERSAMPLSSPSSTSQPSPTLCRPHFKQTLKQELESFERRATSSTLRRMPHASDLRGLQRSTRSYLPEVVLYNHQNQVSWPATSGDLMTAAAMKLIALGLKKLGLSCRADRLRFAMRRGWEAIPSSLA